MSQDFFDPELFADFIAEAKEHLETIEPNLLELEKSPDNLALLNEIFRPMHSLKGASGFLGLNRINQMAHKSENILDALRKGSMVVTPAIMDVILAATDALRQMIDNLEASNAEGDVAIEPIMAQIDAIMAGDAPETAPVAQAPEPSVQAVQEPQPDPAPAAPAEPSPTAEAASTSAAADHGEQLRNQGLSGKEWVATLPAKPVYALTAFGEGHLKDFIDESSEIIENLNNGLLELEENPTGKTDLVNDLFRFFHNMKGNSGIIGYNELNALTHEAETLLNNVRQGKITPSHELIDLLLLVVDMMEALVQKIDVSIGQVTPFETEPVVRQLQAALAGGPVALPDELLTAQGNGQADPEAPPAEEPEPAAQEADHPVEVVSPTIIPVGSEGDDAEAFRVTVRQQMEIIHAALETLKKDGTHKDSIDAIYRCLVAVKNACGFMGLTDIKVYAERTAGIVDQGRTSGIDFGLMVDLLSQEVAIINDMVDKALAEGKAVHVDAPEEPETPPVSPAAAKPAAAATAPQAADPTPSAPKPVAPRPAASPARLQVRPARPACRNTKVLPPSAWITNAWTT